MAKINTKVSKVAGKTEGKADKLSKVNTKSVTIQRTEKKKNDGPVKNLKKLEKSVQKDLKAIPKQAKNKSPKKEKKPKKGQSPAKAKKAGKFEKKTGGAAAAIGPNKKVKKLPKGPKQAKAVSGKDKPQAAAKGELVSKAEIGKTLAAFRAALEVALADKKKAMLDPDFKYILQLCCFKIPQCPERMARTQLAHSLYDETDDVCLFVKDVEAGHKRDYQPSVEYFKEKLAAAGITNVKAVMPMTQIIQEYKQFEMIRKLSATYDCFLADARVSPHISKLMGKHFLKLKKSPIPVRMNHKHLKEHFDKALAKVQYQQTSHGDSIAIYVGKHNMEDSKVIDNIHRTLKNMATEFPGGWANLKRAYLRPAMNLKASILVYANASSGEDVRIPVIEGPKAKAIALKQKALNELLPEGMLVTNKGELAMVANAKKKADKEVHKEKQKKIKEKKEKAAKPDKKKKKQKDIPAVESVVVVEEAVAAPAKKEKKEKKKVEEEPKPIEEVKPVENKKAKKAKVQQQPLPAPSAPVEVTKPEKPAKKNKKAKVEEVDVDDAELSKEVSELWEQIKNESAAELAVESKKGKKKQTKTAPVVTPGPAEKKQSKRKAPQVAQESVSTKKVKGGGAVDKKKAKK